MSGGTGNCHSDEEDVVTTAIFGALKRTSSNLWICIFFASIPKIEKFSKFLDPADFCNFGNFGAGQAGPGTFRTAEAGPGARARPAIHGFTSKIPEIF